MAKRKAKRKKSQNSGFFVNLITVFLTIAASPFIIAFAFLSAFFAKSPKKHPSKSSKKVVAYSSTLARIDQMEGTEFEAFAADLLRQLGYERVKMTPATGDQGVDITAVKGDKKYAIQCKRYAKKLGNTPVQEVNAGKTIYGCNIAVVLTNNYFTSGGKEAARALGVELWDRDVLQKLITYAEFKSGVI